MGNRGFMRKVAIIGCLAMLVTLLPLLTIPASAATWDQVANDGVTNANNIFALPGEEFGGEPTFGSIWLPLVAPAIPGGAVSMYTYDGSAFTAIPTAGFEDSGNNLCLISTAEYDGELDIGTYNANIGSELYAWGGTGNPVPVPDSHHGWGEGVSNDTTIPLGVINNELIVSLQNLDAAPLGGCRVYKNDGSNWTQIIGQGVPGTPTGPGFGDSNNTTVVMPMGDTILYHGEMILVVQNLATGLSVFTYDGTSFTSIGKAGDPGLWTNNHIMGSVTTSLVDDKVYLGTLRDPADGAGGEMWSYDGTGWTEVVGPGAGTPAPGFGDPNNYALVPLARGSDLYVASWNDNIGCRIRKRDGSVFNTISDANFGQALADLNNCAILKSYQGRLYACTANQNGYEIWRTSVPPSIDRLVPNSGPYGATIAIEGHDFMNEQGTGTVTFNGAEAIDLISWSDTCIEVMVPPEATAGPVQVSQSNGDSNEVDFTVTLSDTYYFAEGSTRDNAIDGSYEEWICLQNPGAVDATVTLTYMLTGGATEVQNVTVEQESRETVNVNAFLGPDKDVSTLVESNQLILAERPMYFNYRNKWTGGHDVMGVPAPRDTYYFAEGTTRDNVNDGTYEEWLCLQNPGAVDADVKVTYMLRTGQNIEETYPVGATSRETIDVNTAVGPNQDVSMLVESTVPIVAERPMYFNYRNKWSGGHDVVGAPGPDTMFNFAEGTTRRNPTDGDFDTWITIQNPQNTAADVTITYYTTTAGVQTQNVTVGPTSRETVDVWLALGSDVDTSFTVESTNNVPILVERPMYFNYHSIWPGGHDVMGCASPKASWFFAEGATYAGQFDTYVAVMNPSANAATVQITYMIEGGANQTETVTVAPNTRYTTNIAGVAGMDKNVSIEIQSDQPIVAERPMYFGYKGKWAGGHDTLGYGI